MPQLTRWCAFSLALHLVAVTALVLPAPPGSRRIPPAIMVVLDRPAAPESARHGETRAPVPSVPGPVPPARFAGKPLPAAAKPRKAQPGAAAPGAAAPAPPEPVPSPEAGAKPPPERPRPEDVPQAAAEPASGAGRAQPPAAAAARPVLQAVAAALPAQEMAQKRYLKEQFGYISELIARRLVYPPAARRMNWSGKVVLAFSIAEDGSVHGIRVAQGSGFPILDNSALETVRRAAPFPKPPVRAEIVVPIRFRMTP